MIDAPLSARPELAACWESVVRGTWHSVIVTDRDGRIVWANDAFTELTGYGLEEALDRSPGALLQCDDTDPRTVEFMRRSLTAGDGFRVEVLNRSKTGRRYWLDLDVRPLHGPDGECTGFFGIQADVTRAKEAEARLRRQSATLAAVGRIARIGGWEIDLHHNRASWSREACELLGFAPDTDPDLDAVLGVFAAEERARVAAAIEEARTVGDTFRVDSQIVSEDGRRRWVRMFGERALVGGRPVLRGALQDVHEEKAMMERVEASERFAQATLDALSASVCVLNERGEIMAVNETWRRFGEDNGLQSRDACLGLNYIAVSRGGGDPTGEAVADGIAEVAEGRQEVFETEYPCHSQTEARWYWLRATRFPGVSPARVVVVHQPITALKLSQERLTEAVHDLESARAAAEAAGRSKARFLNALGDEIRGPLSSVQGALALLRDADAAATPERRELVEMACRSADNLSALLEDVFDHARIETQGVDLRPEPADPWSVIQNVCESYRSRAERRGVSLRAERFGSEGWVDVDPGRLRQVVGRLLSQTLRGAVSEILVRLRQYVPKSGQGRLTVEVCTPGAIDAPAPPDVEDAAGGDAGFAVARHVAEIMGGKVEIEGSDEGLTYRLRLPVSAAREPRRGAGAAPRGEAAPLSVLVVEDNPTIQRVVASHLDSFGCRFTMAETGQAALAACAAARFDLVLMSVALPGLDGLETTRRLRVTEGYAETPVVALAPLSEMSRAGEFVRAGMTGVLPKPVRADSLTALLAEIAPAA